MHNILNNFVDVTINDFANSVTGKSRPKKSLSNVVQVLKQMGEEKAWDENDLYEGDFDVVKQEDEDGTVSVVVRKVQIIIIKRTCNENRSYKRFTKFLL